MSNPEKPGGIRAPTEIRGFDENGVERPYTGLHIRAIRFGPGLITKLDTSVTPPVLDVDVRPLPSL
jgi:hypothetical protein